MAGQGVKTGRLGLTRLDLREGMCWGQGHAPAISLLDVMLEGVFLGSGSLNTIIGPPHREVRDCVSEFSPVPKSPAL